MKFFLYGVAVVCAQLLASNVEVFRIIQQVNYTCKESHCLLLETSQTSYALSSVQAGLTCESLLCSTFSLIPYSTQDFFKVKTSLVVFVNESLALPRILPPFPEMFAVNGNTTSNHCGQVALHEFGVPVHDPLDFTMALQHGSWGGLNNNLALGPLPQMESLLKTNPCVPTLRKYSHLGILDAEDDDIFSHCVFPNEEDDDIVNEELFAKAFELGLISQDSFQLGRMAYVSQIFQSGAPLRRLWLSVSWVPVFESYGENKIGRGERYDVLLMELVETNASSSVHILTVGGNRLFVQHRHFLALVSPHNEDLESVLKTVLATIEPRLLYSLEQIVWGMGFSGHGVMYSDIQQDWNADPIYQSHGEFLPREEL